MNILRNNPYRLLGVYSNSPTKERLANHNRMKAFLKVGKPVSFPIDLPQYLSSINRTEASVVEAEAKLTLPKDQILYAQFWFVKTTPLDGVAFNHLIAGEKDKAEEIWRKRESASSLQNLIVCALIRKNYDCAIRYAEVLYGNTQYVNQLISEIIGIGGNFDVANLTFSFLDVLCDEIGTSNLLPFITNNTWKKHIGEKAVRPLVNSIQGAIDVAQKSKGQGPNARLNAGETLKRNTRKDLLQLKSFLSVDDLQYQMIADKLAREILQCGIDYYNKTEDDDALQKTMALHKYALFIAVGQMVKERCKENVEILESVSMEYDAVRRIEENIKELKWENESSHLQQLGHSGEIVQRIVEKCIPDIKTIREKMGSSADTYLRVTSEVVSAAVNALVKYVNLGMQAYTGDVNNLRPIISEAVKAMKTIGTLDMNDDARNYYVENNRKLREMKEQLPSIGDKYSSGGYSSSRGYSSSGGNSTIGGYSSPRGNFTIEVEDEPSSGSNLLSKTKVLIGCLICMLIALWACIISIIAS